MLVVDNRAIQYADDSLGHVRVQSESLFIALKKSFRDHTSIGEYIQFGRMDNGEYVPHLPQKRKLYELSLAVWLAVQDGLEFTGCAVFRNKLRIK